MSQAVNLKDVWKKYNIWISISGFLALLIVVWMFVVAPIRRSIESNADETQKKTIDLEMYGGRISKIADMENIQSVFAENESNLRVFLDKNNEVDFIKKLELISEETGNKISLQIVDDSVAKKSAAAGKKEKEGEDIKKTLPKIPYLSIIISLEGDYEQMVNFLHKIENMNYHVDVISVSMEKSEIKEPAGDPFATDKAKPGVISAPTELIKANLEAVVYLEK